MQRAVPCLYSLRISLIKSRSSSDWGTMTCRLIPPLSFFLKMMLGGALFIRIPKPSSSFSRIFLCPRGLSTSNTMKMMLAVRATAITLKRNFRKMCFHSSSHLSSSTLSVLCSFNDPGEVKQLNFGSLNQSQVIYSRQPCISSSQVTKYFCCKHLTLYLMQPGTVVRVVNS